jgi:hypothetical protein
MILERENTSAIRDPSVEQLTDALRALRSSGPSAFATLTADDGVYLQTAGGPGGLLLEKHTPALGRHFRAFQTPAVVPFPDETELVFSAGRIKLQSGEWFQLRQVVEVFESFLLGKDTPPFVQWRDVSEMFARP